MSQNNIFARLREQAEQRKESEENGFSDLIIDLSNLDLSDVQHLVQELQIYQVELEIQNEELRNTQQSLESARDRFAELYHTAPIGYLTLSRSGVILEANETCADMVLMRRSRLLSRPFAFFIDRPDLEKYANYMRELFADAARGGTKEVEIRVKLADGSVRYTSLTGSIENSKRFEALVCRLVLVDIHERKELERTQELMRAAIDAGADGIAISDLRERGFPLLYVNSQMSRLIDIDVESLSGQTWQGLYDSLVDDNDLARLEDAITSGKRFELTLRVQNAGSLSSWFDIVLYPLNDRFGRIAYCVHVLRDVSERMRAEEALRRSYHIDTVSALVSGFATEFDGLLAKATSQASVALMLADENDPVKGYLQNSIKVIDEATNLVRRLQAYAGYSSGDVALWNFNQLVNDTVAFSRHSIPAHVALDLHLSTRPLTIRANRGQVQQIILNLLINGWEAIEEAGKVTIETGVWNKSHADSADVLWVHRPTLPVNIVYLTVKNSGATITQPLTTLFDPFFTTKEAGRGFGLAATLGAVRANQGAIGARSDLECTAFTVLLPHHVDS